MFDHQISWRNEAKYLDCWGSAKPKAALRRSKLNANTDLKLYKMIIRRVVPYASSCWGYTAKIHVQKLQVVHNRVLRLVVAAPWYLRNSLIHRDFEMQTIAEFIRNGAVKLFDDLKHHANPLESYTEREYDEEATQAQAAQDGAAR